MKSLYKSMLVKSIRVGWVAGCEYASNQLTGAEVVSIGITQLFEDVFPLDVDLQKCVSEIKNRQWAELCHRGTHHSVLDYTDKIMDFVDTQTIDESNLMLEAGKLGLRISPRGLLCFGAWLEYGGVKTSRSVDFSTCSDCLSIWFFDQHVYGYHSDYVLTGTTGGHRNLSETIQREGWEYVRKRMHTSRKIKDRWSQRMLNF